MDKALDRVVIAAPCPMSWDAMVGDDRVRHCGGCSRNVYNISDMTQIEAELFFKEQGSSQCVTFYRRTDGKVMTDNCPKGLRALRNKFRLMIKVVAGCAASILACVPLGRWQSAYAQPAPDQSGQQATPSQQPPKQTDQPVPLRGEMYIPPPKSTDPNTQKNNAPTLLGGKPMMVTPTTAASDKSCHKQIMMNGDVCPDSKANAPEKVNSNKKDLRDNRAYQLYLDAKKNDEAGKLLLAQTQYQQAMNIALQASTADPKFIVLLTNALAHVKSRIDTPIYHSSH